MNFARPYLSFRLGRRLMLAAAGVGLILALVLSGFSMVQSYRHLTSDLARNLGNMVETNLPVLRETLWLGDEILLRGHLNGFKNHDYVALAEIEREGRPSLSAGIRPPAGVRVIEKRVPISTTFRDREVALGTLVLIADLEPILAKFRNNAFRILATQVLTVALIAGSILVLYHNLVGRRLRRMAEFLSGADHREAGQRLARSSAGSRADSFDELDILALSFDDLLARQELHLKQLRAAGERLEARVARRTRELSAEVEEHQRTRRELERSNAELEQFAYVASHDLQEPLRTVATYVQMVQRRYAPQLDADAQEFMDFAVDGAKRMQAMIRDLLEYSRVTTKGGAFAEEPLQDIFQAATTNLSAAIKDSNATVAAGPLPRVTCDRAQIVRLFQNLIGNALKYQPKGRAAEVRIEALRRNGEWLVSVRDNGIGIEAEYLETVFQIFQRLHGTSEYKGSGIGLAVCRKIVERHHGRIWAESEPGKGSTFFFTLPD